MEKVVLTILLVCSCSGEPPLLERESAPDARPSKSVEDSNQSRQSVSEDTNQPSAKAFDMNERYNFEISDGKSCTFKFEKKTFDEGCQLLIQENPECGTCLEKVHDIACKQKKGFEEGLNYVKANGC